MKKTSANRAEYPLLIVLIILYLGLVSAAVPTVIVINPNGDVNYLVGSQTIDFNVADVDANSNADSNLMAKIYYSSSTGGYENLIVDLNLMNTTYCGDQNFALDNNNLCSYSWDTTGVTDGNYFIDINVVDYSMPGDTFRDSGDDSSDGEVAVSNVADVTVSDPNGDGNYLVGTQAIVFTVLDYSITGTADGDLNALIYYSSTQSAFSNLIIDLNLFASGVCTGTDFSTQRTCTYAWDTTDVTDGNYYIDINVADFTTADVIRDSNTDSSDGSFAVDNDVGTPTITSPRDGYTTESNRLTLSYTSSEPNIKKYWLRMDTGDWIDNGTNTSYTFTLLSAGTHTFSLIVENQADQNSSTASISVRFWSAEASVCGDGSCTGNETATTCPRDCSAVCGDSACTHTESITTCPQDCGPAVVCGDGTCEGDETYLNCPQDCPTPPEVVRETIFEETFTGKPTADEIVTILTEAGASQNAIEKASQAVGKTTVERHVKVDKITDGEGNVSYSTTMTITVKNPGSKKLKAVKVVEKIPKSVALNASEISSTVTFEVLKDDPIVKFDLGSISAGENKQLSYTVVKEVTEKQIGEFSQPIVSEAEEEVAPIVKCTVDADCDDANPCTNDVCVEGECSFIPVADGTTCGYGKECRIGVCKAVVPGVVPPPEGVGLGLLVIGVIVIAAIIGAAYYFFIVPKKK